MKHEQLNYFDALRYLAKKYNIEIQERELTDKEKQRKSDRESMLIVNSWAQQYFTTQLYEHVEGKTSDCATLPNVVPRRHHPQIPVGLQPRQARCLYTRKLPKTVIRKSFWKRPVWLLPTITEGSMTVFVGV